MLSRPWAATVNPQVTGEALRLQLNSPPPPKKGKLSYYLPIFTAFRCGLELQTRLISSSDPVYSTRPYLGQQLKPEGFSLAALRTLWADSLHKHYSVQVNEAAYEEASEVKQCSLAGVRLLSRNLDHTVIYSPCQAAFSLMRRLGAWFFRRSFHHHHHWAVSLSNTRGAASNSNGRSCKKNDAAGTEIPRSITHPETDRSCFCCAGGEKQKVGWGEVSVVGAPLGLQEKKTFIQTPGRHPGIIRRGERSQGK